jgi:hypothetical protein
VLCNEDAIALRRTLQLHACEVEVLDVRPSTTKPDLGIAWPRYQAKNQRNEAAPSFIVNHLLRRRKA